MSANFEKEWKALFAEISSTEVFEGDSKEKQKARIARAGKDKLYFAKEYFPARFDKAFAPFHKEWCTISEMRNEPVMVKAMRGAGKSTFFTIVDALHAIVFNRAKYLIFVGYVEAKSEAYSRRIFAEILFNKRLQNDFRLRMKKDDGLGWKASFKDFVLFRGDNWGDQVRVQAVSMGQDPRGLISDDGVRPDYVRLDDIQNSKKAHSRKWVNACLNWIMADLLPALKENYSCIIVGTVMADRDLIHALESGNGEFKPVKTYTYYANEDGREDGKSTWPESYSKERLLSIKAVVGRRTYMQEYNHVPKQRDDKVFNAFKRCSLAEMESQNYEAIVSWTDPSPNKGKGDFKAVIGLGLSNGRAYVLFAWIKKSTVANMISAMYRLYDEYNPHIMYYEGNAGQSYLESTFHNEASKRGQPLPLKALNNVQNKEARIEQTLAVAIENGSLVFCEDVGDSKLLIEQLEDFPLGAHDDGPDALEGCYRMLMASYNKLKARLPKSRRPLTAKKMRGRF